MDHMNDIYMVGAGWVPGGGCGHSGIVPVVLPDVGEVRPARGPSPVRIC